MLALAGRAGRWSARRRCWSAPRWSPGTGRRRRPTSPRWPPPGGRCSATRRPAPPAADVARANGADAGRLRRRTPDGGGRGAGHRAGPAGPARGHPGAAGRARAGPVPWDARRDRAGQKTRSSSGGRAYRSSASGPPARRASASGQGRPRRAAAARRPQGRTGRSGPPAARRRERPGVRRWRWPPGPARTPRPGRVVGSVGGASSGRVRRRGRASPGRGQLVEDHVEHPHRAGLVQRVVAVAALGRLHARRAAALALAAGHRGPGRLSASGAAPRTRARRSRRRRGARRRRRSSPSRCPGAARSRARRGPSGRRWPAAAGCRSRRARRRAASRAAPASSTSARCDRPLVEGQPHRAGAQLPGRQVQRELGQHLAGAQPAPLVGHHLVGHVDDAGVRGDGAQPAGACRSSTIAEVGDVAGDRRPLRALRVHHRAGVLDVELVDDEGLAAVHVQRAVVDGRSARRRRPRCPAAGRWPPSMIDTGSAAAARGCPRRAGRGRPSTSRPGRRRSCPAATSSLERGLAPPAPPKSARSSGGQRQLGGRAAQLRARARRGWSGR